MGNRAGSHDPRPRLLVRSIARVRPLPTRGRPVYRDRMARVVSPARLALLTATALVAAPALTGCGGSTPEGTSPQPPVEADSKPATPATPEAADPAAPTVAPTSFEDAEGNYGYKNAAGEVVIPAKYGLAGEFQDRVAGVCGEDGCAFIDWTGATLATPFLFDNGPDEFVDGRARIVEGSAETAKFGFIADTGEIVVAPTYSFARAFSGGFAAVCDGCKVESDGEHSRHVGGKWGYVDRDGKLVIPAQYDEAGSFEDGKAEVVLAGKTSTIDAPE